MNTDTLLEFLGTFVGIIYLILEYRASIYLWLAGIVMPAIYIVVYFNAGLYADFGMNIYYLLAAVYGFAVWKMGPKMGLWKVKNKQKKELPISHCPRKLWLQQIGLFLFCFFILVYILKHFTDSTVPVWDSFVNALSILGLWQLSRKYVEQWLIWIVVDATSVVLYFYKGLISTPWLYLLYTIIAIFGYFKWKKMMKQGSLS